MTFATQDQLNWNVVSRPLTYEVDGVQHQVPGKQVQLRDDFNTSLGITSDSYTVFQNSELRALVAPMVEEGLIQVTNIGYLGTGSKVFIQAEMTESYKVVGEEHKGSLTILNSHDGTSALAAGVTDTRVICSNTFASALTDLDTRLRHTSDISVKALDIKSTINFVNEGMAKFAQASELLATTRCDEEMLNNLITEAYGRETVRARNQIVEFYRSGVGNEGKTLWDALNGVTQYVTHNSNKNEGKRFASSNFGAGAAVSRRFMNQALALV